MTTCCVDSNLSNAVDAARTAPDWPGRLVRQWRHWWQQRQKRQADRRAIAYMQTLDDTMLRDIGLHRGDISWASNLPKSADALTELELLARGHRTRRDL